MPRPLKRDTTRALELIVRLRTTYEDVLHESSDARDLQRLLEDMDARTGRRDPSKRPER